MLGHVGRQGKFFGLIDERLSSSDKEQPVTKIIKSFHKSRHYGIIRVSQRLWLTLGIMQITFKNCNNFVRVHLELKRSKNYHDGVISDFAIIFLQ